LISSSVVALIISLIATVGVASYAMADPAPNFNFNYDGSYGTAGLSQPYGLSTSTGQSYGVGVAINANDVAQKTYSLVATSPLNGPGGCQGCFPASSTTPTAGTGTTPTTYLGPYSIVRRTSDGDIDTSFGDNGYVTGFNGNADTSYQLRNLCIDPGTGDIVVVGTEKTSSSTDDVVERLLPPNRGSDTAELDTSFNANGTTPGVVTFATSAASAVYTCTVSDNGPGHNGDIYVGGVGSASTSAPIMAAKIDGNGSMDTSFGNDGIAEWAVDSLDGTSTASEMVHISVTGTGSGVSDVILSGFSFTHGLSEGLKATATSIVVAADEHTGALDTNFGGTGQILDSAYGSAVDAQVVSSYGKPTQLDVVYGSVISDSAALIEYPITDGKVDTSASQSLSGTFIVPSDWSAAQGFAVNNRGQIVVSGDTSSHAEQLTVIGGSHDLATV
jgi:hypothetical protein